MIRLQKILSHAGLASRRLAEELIRQGRVTVNGKVVTELGTKADPSRDTIKVDDRRVKQDPSPRRYFLLNKPRGVVSTRSDPQGRETVVDLLSKAGVRGYYYPVGRLDYDSEGLILLTNDGAFAERVTHPKHEMERLYEARVLGIPDARDLERLGKGIVVDGRRTQPAQIRVIATYPSKKEPQALLEVVLREGRNRQVRRMCEGIGHPVMRLKRTRLGPLSDKLLRPGQVRELTDREVSDLIRPAQKTSAPAAKPAAHAVTPAAHAPKPAAHSPAGTARPTRPARHDGRPDSVGTPHVGAGFSPPVRPAKAGPYARKSAGRERRPAGKHSGRTAARPTRRRRSARSRNE